MKRRSVLKPQPVHAMTREATRSAQGQPRRLNHGTSADDVIASLWEHVPFSRLPADAPSELHQYVVDVENPKRVYAVYRATRRHNFQLLVEKYVVQLRYGCDSNTCCTPTCFSYRKRHVGKAPIRRYNSTSARTLASYLASQDNPENSLCPHLRSPKAPPAALGSLVFEPKRPPTEKFAPKDVGQKPQSETCTPAIDTESSKQNKRTQVSGTGSALAPAFSIHERLVSKDYRSFAANVFGTVAFKMLEWLTPNGVAAMTDKVSEIQRRVEHESKPVPGPVPNETPLNSIETTAPPQTPSRPHPPSSQQDSATETPTRSHARTSHLERASTLPRAARDAPPASGAPRDPLVEWGSGLPPLAMPPVSTARTERPVSQRRNSNARVKTTSASKSKRQLSIDKFHASSDEVLPSLKSPRLGAGSKPEKVTKPFLTTASGLTRGLSRPSSEKLFQRTASPESIVLSQRIDISPVNEGKICPSPKPSEGPQDSGHSAQDTSETNTDAVDADSDAGTEVLPQSLSTLNLEIVDLLCDILQEDGTSEAHFFQPAKYLRSCYRNIQTTAELKRKRSSKRKYPAALRSQWKMFIEQSLFNVLSDPCAVVNSFTTETGLLDSQCLWYCMVRITRVAPSLALDSLWIAAGSLFAPPKRLHNLRSPTTKFFRIPERSLTNEEASHLLAICLHALVALCPAVQSTPDMFEVSRLRSHGISIDNARPSLGKIAKLCLQYDDAFSDELAMRLARRLFSAISTRRGFKELVEIDLDFDLDKPETDVLDTILAQIEAITDDSILPSSISFSNEQRQSHEKRVTTLLLDWARAVMLREWDGKPTVNLAGPFGGALTLISAVYERRRSVHVGDANFRSDYFSERLDSVEMPIGWLNFSSSRQKRHLLDYPYIFNPATLVSYFRALNFSRMNRSYEESSSLQNRMRHIMQQGSIISKEAHKQLLSDLLRTASCQFLILDIRRKDLMKDAFDQLWRREERELLRPLKIHLGEENGEEGFDSGGVQQEFFRLALAQALGSNYGLFTTDESTRMTWFRPGGVEPEWKFEMVGLILSLAVYNGLTLPVSFPEALYRKLLGEPVTDIHHIADGWPELARNLTQLLEWDETYGTVEDVIARTYEFSVEAFGVHVSREMIPAAASTLRNNKEPRWPSWHSSMAPPTTGNPADAPMVTGENRYAYVNDYIQYLTDISVAPQYKAFERGFRTVLHPKSLSLLTPPLLRNLVEGDQTIDMSELRRHARYVGWDATHRTVRDFWSIVKSYDETMKRKLLEFVTASDRVPIGGIKSLQFVIQKNGTQDDDKGHLPTAYTCYGTLLLPEYRDREVLRERLSMALENAQGFGFA